MDTLALKTEVLRAIQAQLPPTVDVTGVLSRILSIERKTMYRKLNKEIPFSFDELAVLSTELDLSLDGIVASSSSKNKFFLLKALNHIEPDDTDYDMMEEYIQVLKSAREASVSEITECTNMIPLPLYVDYEYINRFMLFKSFHQIYHTSPDSTKRFSEIELDKKVQWLQKAHATEVRYIKKTCYILDPFIFRYLVNDIHYYKRIHLVSNEDVSHLKTELTGLLDDIQSIATRGCYADTGNEMLIHVSHISFDTSYWYVKINNFHVSLIKAFILNNFASLDKEIFEMVKNRTDGLLRCSTTISISGEEQRLAFMEEQRRIINSL
jgi:hypothetical protein